MVNSKKRSRTLSIMLWTRTFLVLTVTLSHVQFKTHSIPETLRVLSINTDSWILVTNI